MSPYGQARYLGRRCFAPRGARLLCMQLGDQGSALLHSADGKSSVSLWLLQHSGADCWGRVSERGVSSPVLSDGERAAWQRRGVAFRSHVGRGVQRRGQEVGRLSRVGRERSFGGRGRSCGRAPRGDGLQFGWAVAPAGVLGCCPGFLVWRLQVAARGFSPQRYMRVPYACSDGRLGGGCQFTRGRRAQVVAGILSGLLALWGFQNCFQRVV